MHRIMFEIGPFTMYSYGVFVAAGFLLGSILIVREASRSELSRDDVFDCLIAVLIGGLIGGRGLFVILNWGYYSQHPLRIFILPEGGLAIQGAIVAAVLSGAIAARIRRISFWKTADIMVPYVALGQSIGRIGCFFNGCCFGKPVTSLPGVVFPGETVARVPVQLYSSLGLLAIFMVLSAMKRRKPFDGYLFVMYLIMYSGLRWFMDVFRGDELFRVFGMTLSQGISIASILAGAAIYFFLLNSKRGSGA